MLGKRQRTTNGKKPGTIYMEPLLFQVAGEDPVVYPPGFFGEGPEERQAPSQSNSFDNEELFIEPEPYESYDADAGDWNPGYDDDFQRLDELDTPHEFISDNASLFRVYDVFLHTAPDPRASRQFYVMNDFEFGSNKDIIVNHSLFAVVALLNVRILYLGSLRRWIFSR